MTNCTFTKKFSPQPCPPPQHLIAISCPRCQHTSTLTLCDQHWDLYQWTLTEDIGANCPTCWNPITAARTDITGQQPITYYGDKTK